MIKFFRHIRRSLINQNQMGKYFKYAIGEILLVVIGILIALQINNWNEQRKAEKLGQDYLKGIKGDLIKDFELLDSILKGYSNDISLINSIDNEFKKPIYEINPRYKQVLIVPDTSRTKYLFYRGISFRPIQATYSSLVADGKSSLIKNRNLFESIQEIYDERHNRIESVYESFKPSEDRIHWNYAYEKKNWNYTDLLNAKNDKIFLDLFNFTEIKYFYSQHLINLRKKMTEVMTLIDKELSID